MKKVLIAVCSLFLSSAVFALTCPAGYVPKCVRFCSCVPAPCLAPWGLYVQTGAKFWAYSQPTADYLAGQNCDQFFVLETCGYGQWSPPLWSVYLNCTEVDTGYPPPPPPCTGSSCDDS